MPEIDLAIIKQMDQQSAFDRVAPSTPTAVVPTVTDHLGDQATNIKPSPTNGPDPTQADRFNLSSIQQRLPYGGSQGGQDRTGFVLTSDLWMQQGKAIALHAGPASANWSLSLRAQDEENKGGHSRYAQARRTSAHGHTNTDLTYFDFPKVQFQFQAGNILPIPGYQGEVRMSDGHRDFHQFFELLNQPPLLPAGDNEGKHNYTWVHYTSLQFPQVTMKGYFDPEGISWEDSSENPVQLNWSASFSIYEMTPNLWDTSEMEETYATVMKDVARMF